MLLISSGNNNKTYLNDRFGYSPLDTSSMWMHFLKRKTEIYHMSSAECNKVVSDIFGKFEFLMKYPNMDSYTLF